MNYLSTKCPEKLLSFIERWRCGAGEEVGRKKNKKPERLKVYLSGSIRSLFG